ncbi:3-hydroxyacyl-CoA dehydrogenase [Achromobacter sp. K91]|uniref:3-hydroxyacyl-CoA dehydrogenase NAD-binding domain-containing protein n=1 Tax=Achromobacter sp. K91 TaxID=2292262 RepID=UPI000E6602D4|nr:3-hydroxyacyl-CoA dehydrogenase NAD-binding domain-containing protein [Achromobacter sp. K91]RIJ03248.1 3-hydroxyacyl-CoA dehydrogenase [Achromobacter sp. K91]
MPQDKSPSVQTSLHGEILCIHVNNPPVNALSLDVRVGLLNSIQNAQTNDSVRAVVIVGEGGCFIAGADIREFGSPPSAPSLPEVCDALESSTKLVVAALHGATLGGGLEIAMSAHYRVATREARFGLPEVTLGLLPGSGGTQRAPRLMGVVAAAEVILSGRQMTAGEALRAGLIDEIAEGANQQSVGITYAKRLLNSDTPIRRTRDIEVADKAAAATKLATLELQTSKQARGLFSPRKIIECLRAAVEMPFDQGLRRERELFLECMDSPQRKGLVHAFFSEREVLKVPEARAGSNRIVNRISVIGGGTMGAGISVAALNAGLHVTMLERDEESAKRGRENVEQVYDRLVNKERMTAAAKAEIMCRFGTTTHYADLAGVDMVIEAVFENMDVKTDVFKKLDLVCPPGTILATNTSYLDINNIAAVTSRPQDVIGLHFFSPAHIMKLLEIVVADKTSPQVVAAAFSMAKRLKKVPVRAGVCDGFIGNRILYVYREAANFMLEDGASPYEIDAALEEFGYAMGPYRTADLTGGDIGWATRKRKALTRDPKARYVEVADRLCERGWFGQKTQRGWYLYPNGSRSGWTDPEVLAIIDSERTRKGIVPRKFKPEEIVRRYMVAMVNEGAKVLQEGIALRPLDIDVAFVHGYGFPRYRGGPMKWADMQGLGGVLDDLRAYAREDAEFWKPADLLVQLVARGHDFGSLNRL